MTTITCQPATCANGATIGFEALLRWRHPTRGLVSPAEFIPLAEETGLIVPIGDFVIETACRQLAVWQQQGYDTLSLAVNISAVQFWRGDLYETVSHAIEESGISARRLELEITETLAMHCSDEVLEAIALLRADGLAVEETPLLPSDFAAADEIFSILMARTSSRAAPSSSATPQTCASSTSDPAGAHRDDPPCPPFGTTPR